MDPTARPAGPTLDQDVVGSAISCSLMVRYAIASVVVFGLAVAVIAQVPVWGRCGGNGWTAGYRKETQADGHGRPTVEATGDSYTQSGFNMSLAKPNPQNPLGNPPVPGWTSSGGLNWAGFLVTQLNASVVYSYNLASGGATTDRALVAPSMSTALDLVDQVAFFKDTVGKRPAWVPWTAEDTLVGVWMGANDVGIAFNEPEDRVPPLLDKVVGSYFNQLQILHDAGLRNFVLLGVPPTQKTPLQLANSPKARAALAEAGRLYSDLVVRGLASFKAANADLSVAVFVDTAAPFNEALDHPTAYGAPNATCVNDNGFSCLWYDTYHPATQIHRLVALAVAKAVGRPWFTL
ncbi:fungal cellulose binding domain-containing protein [Magnaporthiopsis poae ATCC 64411]|uniref:Fungal cellulose binding domain-containing protein n=1 Tax=Magnaporthiopsis poae (strain ATCC 64411 / 73-15) TaxID=644358 RepID=A0A0C4DPV5_MAGP6|nr:fungal cellulose binding domain-containing protein [Magnaporthiopsis poae ATCC 64411]